MPSYTTTTNKLKITELDFSAIKDALKTYLQGQTEFLDYDFEGSAMSILIDILAYNTHYNGFYTNMLASEMFLDSATLRSSVVSLAKHLGYTPTSRKGSTIKLDMSFTTSAPVSSILIPKNAKFTTKIGSDSYTFLATESRTASLNAEKTSYDIVNVQIKEGILVSSEYTIVGTTDNEVFPIPNEDIDLDTLGVSVGGEVYTKVDDITEVKSTDKVYFIQEGREKQYEIYFGDGVIGKKPSTDDEVRLEYFVSQLGEDGNGARKFSLAESLVGGIASVTISLSVGYVRSSGGAEREEVSTVRLQAPRQYALQKRVVTAQDYKARLSADYNIVDSVRVWGGEENIPPQYGKVFISIKPKTGYVLSNAEKLKVANDILKKRNMITISPEFVDPDYLFIVPNVTIAYDIRKTTRTSDQLIAMAKTTIEKYSSDNLGKFDEYFRHSVLTRAIDDTEVAILNSNMDVAIKKRIKPILGVAGSYRRYFDNKLYRPHTGHRNILTSTMFTYAGKTKCSLSDKDGIISVVQADYKSETSGGYARNTQNGFVVADMVGNIDYDSGEIFLDKFRPTSIDDGSEYIYIAVKPRIDDIMPRGNTIVVIESPDITVTAIDDTDRLVQMKTQGY